LLEYLLWLVRRNEDDLINIYNFLTPLVKLANGGDTLNRGYWNEETRNPVQAQEALCKVISQFGSFNSAQTILDVGSGASGPALNFKSFYNFLDIICMDLNFNQIRNVVRNTDESTKSEKISLKPNANILRYINGSANILPFKSRSIDRIVALESHHHFRPLNLFFQESRRVLKDNGSLIIATPVKTFDSSFLSEILTLGLLSLTFGSKNLLLSYLKSTLGSCGFQITDILSIGNYVFPRQTENYIRNRESIKQRIPSQYPSYTERLLYKMIMKTKNVYQKGKIDYLLIKSQPV
jgi:SAM-dependent methyltransferase